MAEIYAADPNHPDHDEYLRQLGRVVLLSAELASASIGFEQIHDGATLSDRERQTLGGLRKKLQGSRSTPTEQVQALYHEAIDARNDVIHALAYRGALIRNTGPDQHLHFLAPSDLDPIISTIETAVDALQQATFFDKGQAWREYHWNRLYPGVNMP